MLLIKIHTFITLYGNMEIEALILRGKFMKFANQMYRDK